MTPSEAMRVAAEFEKQKYVIFGNRVAVILDEAEHQTTGGIIIPNEGIKRHSGTVVSIGRGVFIDKEFGNIKIGDRVLLSRYAAMGQEAALTRLDGSEVVVNIMHSHDLYVGWEDPDLRAEYEGACDALGITLGN